MKLIDIENATVCIEPKEIEDQGGDYCNGFGDGVLYALDYLTENAPAVDAVEVVRCKDCKHLYDAMDDYCCMSHRGLVRICENSFCSYGERRET